MTGSALIPPGADSVELRSPRIDGATVRRLLFLLACGVAGGAALLDQASKARPAVEHRDHRIATVGS